MKHLNISIRGKVQGVFFRLTTKAVADQVGVRGFVVNLKDGSVYIEGEGDDFALDSLLEFCGWKLNASNTAPPFPPMTA